MNTWNLYVRRNCCISIYAFHLSLRFIPPMTRSVNTHRSIFLRSSISSMDTWACVDGFHSQCIKMPCSNNYAACCRFFNNQRSPCTIWVWCVWCETQQQLNVTVAEFQSSSFRVNCRGPVSPSVTSAVIHKAQSQTIIFQTCLSICMNDSGFVPQYWEAL